MCVCDKVEKWTFSPRTGTSREEKVCSFMYCTCMCVICVAPLWDCALFQVITVQTGKIERKAFPKTAYTYFLYYNSRVQSQMCYKKVKLANYFDFSDFPSILF